MQVQPVVEIPLKARAWGIVSVLLQSGGAQAADSMAVDQTLPGEELLDRQIITATSLLEADQPRTHRHHNLGLAADNPAFGVG